MKRKEDSASTPKKSKRKSGAGKSTPGQQEDASTAAEEDLQLGHDDLEHLPEDDEEGGIRIGDIYIPPPPKGIGAYGTDGPRLMITHIDNENFKSYAGKTTLGPFHKVTIFLILLERRIVQFLTHIDVFSALPQLLGPMEVARAMSLTLCSLCLAIELPRSVLRKYLY